MDHSDIMISTHPPVSPNVDIDNHFILLQKSVRVLDGDSQH